MRWRSPGTWIPKSKISYGRLQLEQARKQHSWATRQIPPTSPESESFSKDLKRRGFSFVRPTVAYAYMQAVGMVNDHLVDRFRYREIQRRLPMRTEFRAVVQSEYGAPEKVLRIAKRRLKSEELGADDVFVRVIARPIHPGDIQILSALPQGGSVEPIPEGTLRIALSLATNHPELFESRMSMNLSIFKKQFSTSLVRERPGSSY